VVAAGVQVESVADLVEAILGDRLRGLYLYGSAVAGGLKPASDLDLFVVTSGRTTAAERRRLINGLRPLSARDVRPARWRPVELTVVAHADIVPWRYPPRVDFQSGEWLRAAFDAGEERPWRTPNADLAIVVAQVRQSGTTLLGCSAGELLPDVPRADLARAMRDEIRFLLDDLETDTANVLLTLARIWHTLATDKFASKDKAADWALHRLPANGRATLKRARDIYLGRAKGSWQEQEAWADELPAAGSAARLLVSHIEGRWFERTF
jgi:streptomycin 3"-adenylyltransferase